MARIFYILCCSVFLFALWAAPATAQSKSKKKASSKKEKTIEDICKEVDSLINCYCFDEAISLMEETQATPVKKKKEVDTSCLNSRLSFARFANNMMLGTERVVFVDSLVVSKANFLSAYHLASENGRVESVKRLLSTIGLPPSIVGQTAFKNELGDKILISTTNADSMLRIVEANKYGDQWLTNNLEGISERDEEQDFPFMMADGVTLYYAAKGRESLGGYDIFVTRFNTESKQYVAPENIGMPFNSPANDYLYVIDETNHIGWFASDRYQAADSVCFYTFIPNESRDIYESAPDKAHQIRLAAMLCPLSASQTNKALIAEAKERLTSLKNRLHVSEVGTSSSYIINDKTVYHSLQEFRSETARRIAQQWDKTLSEIHNKTAELEILRTQYAKTPGKADIAERILALERDLVALRNSALILEKNMRKAELQ